MDLYIAIKRSQALNYSTAWMNLRGIMMRKNPKSTGCGPTHVTSLKCKILVRVYQGLRDGGGWAWCS